MTAARLSLSLVAIVGLTAATIAVATIWLLFTDPVRGADVVKAAASGDPGPAMQAIGSVLYEALRGLFKYL
jgi:hypothetical protein